MKQSDAVAISFAATVFGLAVGIGLMSGASSGVGVVAGMGSIAGGSLNGFYFVRGALNYLQSSPCVEPSAASEAAKPAN